MWEKGKAIGEYRGVNSQLERIGAKNWQGRPFPQKVA
jgi:hypothetical protein